MGETRNAIVFFDGNNFYHNLKASFIKPRKIDLRKVSLLVTEHFNCALKKSIYYNSVPSISDGQDIYYAHIKFLEELKMYQDFDVHTRKLQRLSNQEKIQIMNQEIFNLGLCEICKPIVLSHWSDYIGSISVKEKGIDILIAVEMIKLCLIKNECDACIIITGDADFIPCLDLLKSSGKWVATASTAKGYSYELRKQHTWFILDKKLLLDKCQKNK